MKNDDNYNYEIAKERLDIEYSKIWKIAYMKKKEVAI